MMKKLLVLPIIAAISACSIIGAMGGKVPANLVNENQNLVLAYKAAATSVLSGQKDLAVALDLNDSVKELDGQLEALKSGNITGGTVEKTTELSESINKKLKEKLASNKTLSSEAKVYAAKGLGEYAIGTASTAVLLNSAKNLVSSSKKAMSADGVTPLDKAAIAENMVIGSTVLTQVPSLTKDLVSAGKQFIQFAKSNGVDTKAAQKKMSNIAGF